MIFKDKIFLIILFLMASFNLLADGNTSRKSYAVTNTSGSGVFTFPTTTPTASRACQFDGSGVLESSSTISTTELGFLNDVASALCGINDTCTETNKRFTSPKLNENVAVTTTATQLNYLAAATGTTGTTSTNVVFSTSPTLVTPALGTPSALVGTNITGTASGLTAGSVTTNANLTGPITSSGNATAVASQTGTGSVFVMQASPTLTTPNLGTPSTLVGTNITGTGASFTAGTVTTNANLTGHVTSTGNAAVLGTFSSANLSGALSDESGSGAALFGTSPAIATPNLNGGTASNTSRILLPSDTTSNLDALTDTAGLLAYDTSQSKPVYNNGSSWTAVGSGGSSGVNYFSSNPDAEIGTTGWVTYADAAGSVPVNMVDGSPTTTFTRTTTAPLRGTGSFLITKDAANRQGEGVAFTIATDTADLGKVVQVSFDYTIASGTYASTSSSADLILYAYDVTNSALIEPSGIYIQGATVGLPQKHVATFQLPTSSQSYRVGFHVASTSASAYTVKIDNLSIGPQVGTSGTVITDWKAYTPGTNGFGTPSSVDFWWRRFGDSVQIYGSLTVGTATAAEARIDLPSGLTPDSTKIASAKIVGSAHRGSANADGTEFSVIIGSGQTYMKFGEASAGSAITARNGSDIVSGDPWYVDVVTIPISGWGSTTQMSDSNDGRPVIVEYTNNAGNALTDDTTPITWSTKVKDTHAAWNGTVFTAPYASLYCFSGAYHLTATVAGNVGFVYNGSVLHRIGYSYATTSDQRRFSKCKYLSAGNTVSITSPGAATLFNGSTYHFLEIYSVPAGGQTIAASEKVVAIYESNAGQSMSDGAIEIVNLEDKVKDTHGAVTVGASWKFSAPYANYYTACYSISSSDAVAWTAGDLFNVYIYKNGAAYYNKRQQVSGSTTGYNSDAACTEVYLLSGEYIDFRVYMGTGTGSQPLTSDAAAVRVSVRGL